MLSFATRFLTGGTSITGALTAIAIIFGTGTVVGGWGVYKIWDVSSKIAEARMLRQKVDALEAAQKADAKLATEDAQVSDKLERKVDEVLTESSDRPVLVGPAADRLRNLWN